MDIFDKITTKTPPTSGDIFDRIELPQETPRGSSVLSKATRTFMGASPIESIKTMQESSQDFPEPSPGEGLFSYINKIKGTPALQKREEGITGRGTLPQFGNLMQAGLAVAGANAPLSTLKTVGKFGALEGISEATGLNKAIQGIKQPDIRDIADITKFGAEGGLATQKWPIVGKTAKGIGSVVSKTARGIAKNVGGITDATVVTIKRLGPKKVFDPLKSKADYISQDLTPRVYSGVSKIIQSAHDAYNKAVGSAPEGKSIDIRPAIEKAGNELKQLGLITQTGQMTELGNSEIARDSVYGKLLDFYQSADAISGVGKLIGKPLTEGQMIKASRAMKETLVNKKQFLFFRDKLNALYKNKPSDIDVSGVRDAFYKSAEKSGMKGLSEAKALENNVFEIEGKLDARKITTDLVRAKNPQYTKQIEAEYRKILGEDFKPIWDDLMAHYANIDFGLVTETPGAGGGMYPSRSGLIRSGVSKLTKEYYKTAKPAAEKGGELLRQLIK